MMSIRAAQQRGSADFGWLQSRHSFSFGRYYDQQHMGFSVLRVINDDQVEPGAGFSTHGHQDMEIISFVTQGVMEHKDSMGNIQRLPEGEFQLMSAGSGITHSEYNASDQAPLKFLQIWILPDQLGGEPGYQQKQFGKELGLTPIITPDGRDGTLQIKQQASLSQLILAPGATQLLSLGEQGKGYIHLIGGHLQADELSIDPGDGLKIQQQQQVLVRNDSDIVATGLVFELP